MFLGIGAGLFIDEKGGPANSGAGNSAGSSGGSSGGGSNGEKTYYYKFNHFANGTAGISWPNPPLTNLPVCSQRWGNDGKISILDGMISFLLFFLILILLKYHGLLFQF